MVPPLANTFSSIFQPTVTSALVDNLINNNPTPATLSSVSSTSVTSSALHQNIANANSAAIENLTNTASQLFISNPSNDLIKSEQNAPIQPPSSIPAMYQTQPGEFPVAGQQAVQTEGTMSQLLKYESLIFFDCSNTSGSSVQRAHVQFE